MTALSRLVWARRIISSFSVAPSPHSLCQTRCISCHPSSLSSCPLSWLSRLSPWGWFTPTSPLIDASVMYRHEYLKRHPPQESPACLKMLGAVKTSSSSSSWRGTKMAEWCLNAGSPFRSVQLEFTDRLLTSVSYRIKCVRVSGRSAVLLKYLCAICSVLKMLMSTIAVHNRILIHI